jgi:hypothetical protein
MGLRIKTLRKRAVLGSLLLLMLLFLWGNAWGAGISNDDCMGCHGEKELTGKGPGGKTISLFFSKEVFEKSVHKSLQCVGCHEIKDLPHGEKVNIVACKTCHEGASKRYRMSVHGAGKVGKATCKECHGYHAVEQTKAPATSTCATCHPAVAREYKEGIHARGADGGKAVASCVDCHGKTHDMLEKTNSRSAVYVLNLPRTCSRCHANPEMVKKYNIPAERAYSLYMDSIHGQALTRSGILVSAACNDCHGSHAIKPHTDPTSRINPLNLSATCGKCHSAEEKAFGKSIHAQEIKKGNKGAPNCANCHLSHEVRPVKATAWMLEAIKECGSCHKGPLETYHHSYHGKITNLGFTRVAKCADCHGAHDVRPRSDPGSRISERNIIGTCRQCHPKANKSFTDFVAHVDYRKKGDHPIFYYVWIFMTGLLVAVFGFFGIHTILWLPRSWIERFRERRRKAGR